MSSILLEVNHLTVNYGKVEAVHGIDLQVASGKIVSLLGPNGAGKTTTLSAIMGLIPASGNITFNGVLHKEPNVEEMVLGGLTLVPEKRELFSTMTIQDNLTLGFYQLRTQGKNALKKRLAEIYSIFPRLHERKDQLAGTMSGGERQMLALGRALMSRPKLLMLDEPSLGLAPRIVRDIFQIIQFLKEEGVAILLVEQNAHAALQIADYAYVLENGNIKIHGAANDLRNDPRIIESYLGLSTQHQNTLITP